jgi:hypothetical protein
VDDKLCKCSSIQLTFDQKGNNKEISAEKRTEEEFNLIERSGRKV